MANSIIGAGIIGLPFAFKEAVRQKKKRNQTPSY
jgi:hypothetical protein